jgi:hypothetical protein
VGSRLDSCAAFSVPTYTPQRRSFVIERRRCHVPPMGTTCFFGSLHHWDCVLPSIYHLGNKNQVLFHLLTGCVQAALARLEPMDTSKSVAGQTRQRWQLCLMEDRIGERHCHSRRCTGAEHALNQDVPGAWTWVRIGGTFCSKKE